MGKKLWWQSKLIGKNFLTVIARCGNNEIMTILRDSILKRMSELNLSVYRLAKILKHKIPQRTIYAFLSGESDAGSEVVSELMEVLGLTITANPIIESVNSSDKEIRIMNKKQLFSRTQVIEDIDWENIGKRNANKGKKTNAEKIQRKTSVRLKKMKKTNADSVDVQYLWDCTHELYEYAQSCILLARWCAEQVGKREARLNEIKAIIEKASDEQVNDAMWQRVQAGIRKQKD